MKNWVMSDDTSLDEAMAAARSDEEREAHRAAARRLPRDLQLLHDVPPVHVRQLLEQRRGPLPDLRPAPRPRDPAGAVPGRRALRAGPDRGRGLAGGRPLRAPRPAARPGPQRPATATALHPDHDDAGADATARSERRDPRLRCRGPAGVPVRRDAAPVPSRPRRFRGRSTGWSTSRTPSSPSAEAVVGRARRAVAGRRRADARSTAVDDAAFAAPDRRATLDGLAADCRRRPRPPRAPAPNLRPAGRGSGRDRTSTPSSPRSRQSSTRPRWSSAEEAPEAVAAEPAPAEPEEARRRPGSPLDLRWPERGCRGRGRARGRRARARRGRARARRLAPEPEPEPVARSRPSPSRRRRARARARAGRRRSRSRSPPSPSPSPPPVREDRIEQPTWRIFAPDPTAGAEPVSRPTARPAGPAGPARPASGEPQWPARPDIGSRRAWRSSPTGPGRRATPCGPPRPSEVLSPIVAGRRPHAGVQPCSSCGLSLSATPGSAAAAAPARADRRSDRRTAARRRRERSPDPGGAEQDHGEHQVEPGQADQDRAERAVDEVRRRRGAAPGRRRRRVRTTARARRRRRAAGSRARSAGRAGRAGRPRPAPRPRERRKAGRGACRGPAGSPGRARHLDRDRERRRARSGRRAGSRR